MRPSMLNTVRILKPLSEEGIQVGAIGVIIAIFESPDEAYEVEFSDEEGQSLAQVVLQRKDFDVV